MALVSKTKLTKLTIARLIFINLRMFTILSLGVVDSATTLTSRRDEIIARDVNDHATSSEFSYWQN